MPYHFWRKTSPFQDHQKSKAGSRGLPQASSNVSISCHSHSSWPDTFPVLWWGQLWLGWKCQHAKREALRSKERKCPGRPAPRPPCSFSTEERDLFRQSYGVSWWISFSQIRPFSNHLIFIETFWTLIDKIDIHPHSGVKGDGTLFGYTKIQGSLNSQAYHNLLQHRVLPEVRAGNGGNLQGLTWQQDGAPPHASDQNIRYLGNQFNGRLLARRSERFGGRDWAARSPDLNPLDYGIWGILKGKVFSPRPQTILQLKTRLDHEVASLGADQGLLRCVLDMRLHSSYMLLFRRCVLSILGRAQNVLDNNGGYIDN